MIVQWKTFQSGNRLVEAQVFAPESGSGDAILFCPGFPGVGAALFEQRHAAELVENGYSVIVLRHSGTRLDGPHAPLMVNNAARLAQGRKNGDTHLGGGPSSVEAWLEEPLTALESIAGQYKNIHVIGNSFGALSAMWSLTAPGAPLQNIRHLLLQAGAQGVDRGAADDVMRIWKPEFVNMPRITDKVTLDTPEKTVAAVKNCYQNLPARMQGLPASIKLTFLVVARDELLRRSDSEEFQAAIGGRGTIVMDDIDQPHPDHNLMAHDMPDYPTENFLTLIRGLNV